jgi:hypothetical protein
LLVVFAVEWARDAQCSAALIRRTGEVVCGFHGAGNAGVEIGPARVVGGVDAEGEAAVVLELEVDLAVFAGVDDVGAGADAGGEVAAEVCLRC